MLSPMTTPVRHVALGEQLADLLRARIVSGELAPGTHLVEDGLAADYDVSRGPVRDALRILAGEGLVASQRRGLFVRGLDEHDITELYEVREAFEQLACRLAIERGGDWGPAEAELAGMTAAADRSDLHRFAVCDLAFHSYFYDLSGNHRLQALWAQYRPTFAALLDVTNAQDKDLHPAAADHGTLLSLAKARLYDEFAHELTAHLAGSRRRMIEALAGRRSPLAG